MSTSRRGEVILYPKDEIGSHIIKVAKGIFVEKGYHDTEIKDIVQAASVGRTTLYRRFPTKESLAFHVSMEVLMDLFYVEDTDKIAKGKNGLERVEALMHFYVDRMQRGAKQVLYLTEFDFRFGSVFTSAENHDILQILLNDQEVGQGPFEKYLRQGIKDGSIRPDLDVTLTAPTIANVIMATWQRTQTRRDPLMETNGNNDKMVNHILDLLLEAIRHK